MPARGCSRSGVTGLRLGTGRRRDRGRPRSRRPDQHRGADRRRSALPRRRASSSTPKRRWRWSPRRRAKRRSAPPPTSRRATRSSRPSSTSRRATTTFKELRDPQGQARCAPFRRADRIVGEPTAAATRSRPTSRTTVSSPFRRTPARGGLREVRGSMQCPFYIVAALARLFGEPPDRIRVVQATTGGGFGGKEEFPSMIAGHAALLAEACGRPVRMLYDRAEDMAATTKRHPGRVHPPHRRSIAEGRILAHGDRRAARRRRLQRRSRRSCSRAPCCTPRDPTGCDNLRITGRVVKTNTPPNGAFRGFGVPQVAFALERHLDRVAAAARHRSRRAPRGQPARGRRHDRHRPVGGGCRREPSGARRRAGAVEVGGDEAGPRGRGTASTPTSGAASVSPATFTAPASPAAARSASPRSPPWSSLGGRIVRVRTSSTEMGQGTRTVFAQIVAETLGLPYERVETFDPDTALVPDSGPTVASRTVAIVGRIVADAARALDRDARRAGRPRGRQTLERAASSSAPATALSRGGRRPLLPRPFQQPIEPAYSTTRTTSATPTPPTPGPRPSSRSRSTSRASRSRCAGSRARRRSAGRSIRVSPRGSSKAASPRRSGWGLFEEVVMRDGRMANGQLTNYILPTAIDTPPIDLVLLERPCEHGPFGAKGIGELPMDGGAPAAVNAIADALAVDLDRIPASAERIAHAWSARAGAGPGRST